MGIKILTDGAICMCPHGGKLQFIVTHKTADGADGEVLTLRDYGNAMVVGCTLVPPAGVPCMKVGMVIDPVGRVMKIKGDTVITEMVISMTDKGWPITVVSPGRSAISIAFAPVGSFPRQPGKHEVARQKQKLFLGAAQARSLGKAAEAGVPFVEECNQRITPAGAGISKEAQRVISAEWRSDYARREQIVKLHGRTRGFGDGTPATLDIYEQDIRGKRSFIKTLTSTVQDRHVDAEWFYQYEKDVGLLPDKIAGAKHYKPPEYIFDLKVGDKSAQSGLIEFIDWVDVELLDEEGKAIPNANYIAHFADGSKRRGKLDEQGKTQLKDVPPGNVHFELVKDFEGSSGSVHDVFTKESALADSRKSEVKEIILAKWSTDVTTCEGVVSLLGETKGFRNGAAATLEIFELKEDGTEEPVTELRSAVIGNRVEVEWPVECGNGPSTSTRLPVGSPKSIPRQPQIKLPQTEQPVKQPTKKQKEEKVVSAKWSTDTAKYEEVVKLLGKTEGLGNGTAATLKVFKVAEDGREKPVTELSGIVQSDRVKVEWPVEFVEEETSNELKSKPPTKYVFELLARGKSAKSGLLEIKEEILCIRLMGTFFDTNKNFLLPAAMKGVQNLVELCEKRPDSELLIVGHTDRTGDPSENDVLSLERADAVAAFLTDDVDAWLERYDTSIPSEKRWGRLEDLHMLESLDDFSSKPEEQLIVEWFQETRGLTVDNDAGPETRKQLITEYMTHDKTTLPAGIEMVTHGCGGNFPVDEAGNIDLNAPPPDEKSVAKDRRVEVFVFDPPGIRPKPKGKNSGKGK